MGFPQVRGKWIISALFERVERRKSYRNDREFQNRFRVMVLTLALMITTAMALFSLAVSYVVAHPDFLPDSVWVPISFTALAWGIAIAIVYRCDRLSHRLSGPIPRILKILEAVRRGEHSGPIRLRENDEFRVLIDALNETFEVFQSPGASE